MKKNAVSRRDFLAASGVSVVAGLTGSVTEWGWNPGQGRPRSGTSDPWKLDDPRYYSFLYDEGGDRRDYADWGNVQAGIRILERDHGKPFCLFLPLGSPHPPYTAPQGFHNMYDPAKLPPLRPIDLPHKPNFYEAIRKYYHLEPLDEDVFRKIQAVYLGKISYTDWLLGELLAAIERTGHVLHWYVLTGGVAPPDKDPRGSPPYYPTAHFNEKDWQKKILD